jgi:hypothetical protein
LELDWISFVAMHSSKIRDKPVNCLLDIIGPIIDEGVLMISLSRGSRQAGTKQSKQATTSTWRQISHHIHRRTHRLLVKKILHDHGGRKPKSYCVEYLPEYVLTYVHFTAPHQPLERYQSAQQSASSNRIASKVRIFNYVNIDNNGGGGGGGVLIKLFMTKIGCAARAVIATGGRREDW